MNVFDFCSGLILFLIIIFGICGNLISLLVWNKGRRCKKLPGGIYLRALAVSDTIALCIPAMNEAISSVSQFNPKEEYNFFCKLEIVGRHFGLLVSSWIVVCFTLERTLVIFRPTASTNLMSKKGTISLMAIIFVVNLMLNFPFGIVYGLTEQPIFQKLLSADGSNADLNLSTIHGNDSDILTTETIETVIVGYKKRCLGDKASVFHYLNWYHIWLMDVFLIFIIPFGLMTGSNLTVLYFIVSRKKMAKSKLDNKIRAVTMRAVTISVVHCVTAGVFCMSVLIPGYLKTAFNVKYSQEYYINKVFLTLAYVNHAINFILYSFFGTEFRRDCAELLWKRTARVRPDGSSVRPSAMNDLSGVSDSKVDKNRENSKTDKTNISSIAV